MIEQEAIKNINTYIYSELESIPKQLLESLKLACFTLKEVEKYRAIGTVEDIQQKLAELERWHTTEVNPKIKNVFANTSIQICHNCDHKDEYIEELEVEVQQYRAIGTPEECRTAVEKLRKVEEVVKEWDKVGKAVE